VKGVALSGALGIRSRGGGTSLDEVWNGKPDTPSATGGDGVDEGGEPSGAANGVALRETLGKRSRGAGASLGAGVWKGKPDEPTEAGGAEAGAGGFVPSGEPKTGAGGGTLGKRSRGGGASFGGVVWNGKPEPIIGTVDAETGAGDDWGGTLGGEKGVPAIDAGAMFARRPVDEGASARGADVWNGNADEELIAARR
jgi:hypothetical protein